MSATLRDFTPKQELSGQKVLAHFIDSLRHSEVLNARAQFESDAWVVGYQKGKNARMSAVFSTLEASRTASSTPPLPAPFMGFAKAVLIYLHDCRPVVSVGPRITALRCLEAALREWNKGSRPTAVNIEVLDSAVELARRNVSAEVAYRVAGQLKLIAEAMHTLGIITLRHPWSHGMKKPNALGSRISTEALQARQEKMPSAATLQALANIFQDATKPIDVLVSSYTALMLCAPERVNEVLRVRRDCLVDGEGRFVGKLGLRWRGSKGAHDTTKWLPSAMTDLARKALSNLLRVTQPAHELAAWYSRHPDTLYLHKGAAHLRDQEVLTPSELALVLWGDEAASTAAITWADRTAKIQKIARTRRRIGYRFDDVERAVLSMLPHSFPHVPGDAQLLCEDSLAVLRTNESHEIRPVYLCMFFCVDYGTLSSKLSHSESRASIFECFGFREDDGTPMSLRSHSLRHYLNMLAQMGGLSSAEIAIFSGRREEIQNRAYDHRTSDEVQQPISLALKAGFTGNLMTSRARELIPRHSFVSKGLTAAHTTEYGWCLHNFASEPCQMYRDCINCEEHVCVKGEGHKESKLRALEKETEHLLQQAKQALAEDEYGADTWVKHQTKTLERVRSMLTILADPSVIPGSRIRLDVSNAPLITEDEWRPAELVKRLENIVERVNS